MLKTMIHKEEGIDINTYPNLKRFFKEKSTGFISKKAKTFTDDEIKKFLTEAPDHDELDAKVALILGITGALRREEQKNIRLRDIKFEETHLAITIPKTKTKIVRTFTVNSPLKEVIEKYIKTRPSNQTHEELFLQYRSGKCTTRVMGINKIGQMPKRIATWLGLENPEEYTGHSFRRTSATLLANAGASMTTMKRHGGWNSSTTAEGYIADSIANKRKICNQITSSIVDEDDSDDPSRNRAFKRIRFLDHSNNHPSTSAQTSSTTVVNSTAESLIQPRISSSSHSTVSAHPGVARPFIVIELNWPQ
ncbi:hypothetical protein QAD02_021314 [Eretmocerus hayati]|uniref:Uncharacterized protein n=1 Tax=Eretmocerus hayati TaxID=131215 RepID=A0ACC2PPT9_9HYME|nr:hypothetical protein QAD02_021314 [Eretmocerus hayati]